MLLIVSGIVKVCRCSSRSYNVKLLVLNVLDNDSCDFLNQAFGIFNVQTLAILDLLLEDLAHLVDMSANLHQFVADILLGKGSSD